MINTIRYLSRSICVVALCLIAGDGLCLDKDYDVFAPYVRSFLEAGERQGRIVNMEHVNILSFNELPHEWVGMCDMITHTVFVLDSFWNRAPIEQREELIWHELGHCALGRGHKLDKLTSYPSSIMYPYIIPVTQDNNFISNKRGYEEELFKY